MPVEMDDEGGTGFGGGARPSRLPLYLRMADVLRRRLDDGVWMPGDRLPPLTDLAAEFAVAKITVRQAVRILEEEGLVIAQRGRGTTVLPKKPRIERLTVETRLSSLVDMYRGDRPDLALLEDRPAALPPAPFIGKASPDGYHLLRRTHSRGGRAYCAISIYFARPVFARYEDRLRTELALPVLSEADDIAVTRAHQELEVGRCDHESAGLLGLSPGDPVAFVRRILCDADDHVVYLADVTYRGDYVKLKMDLLA